MPFSAPSKLPIFERHFPIMVLRTKVQFLLAMLTFIYILHFFAYYSLCTSSIVRSLFTILNSTLPENHIA